MRLFLASALVAAITPMLLTGDVLADNYLGTSPDYSTKIVVSSDGIKSVKAVRLGNTYEFELQAFSLDVEYAYMCLMVSPGGTWKCRSTIAAGTPDGIYYGSGTDFRITPEMVVAGKVTARALDLLKKPLVTRSLPVLARLPAPKPTFSFSGRSGASDNGEQAIVLRVVAKLAGGALEDYKVCWRRLDGARCVDPESGWEYLTYTAPPRNDFAIPLTTRNVINGVFTAWLQYKGQRVATYTSRA